MRLLRLRGEFSTNRLFAATRCAGEVTGSPNAPEKKLKISLDLIKLSLNICAMDTFMALADPTRRQIIQSLASGESAFGDIADQFEMSRPAVSQHLKVLREAGLVAVRKDAQRRIYRIEASGLRELDEWLEKVRHFWGERLDDLERALQEKN
jgi:DNA-binding transcriptional ArsR family regulator